jgi:pimeloyl-ACP methyl ester carboxylesterase
MALVRRAAKWGGMLLGAVLSLVVGWALLPVWTPSIPSPDGISTLEPVTLGGTQQWILIRGQHTTNPVLLYLHGGPGFAYIPFASRFSPRLEERFIMVQWDQRGAGKSYAAGNLPASMTIDQFVSDTRELVELLRRRFGVRKVYLVGHSWGSILGVKTVQRYPDLFYSYVGAGQSVNLREGEQLSYRYVLERARQSGSDQALRELATLHPPYTGSSEVGLERTWLTRFGGDAYAGSRSPGLSYLLLGVRLLLTPEYTLADALHYFPGVIRSTDLMWREMTEIDLMTSAPSLDVPVYFFEGRHDHLTPVELVERYVETLQAPRKEIVWFERSGHFVQFEEPERFADMMIGKVLAENDVTQETRRR